jgi:phage baseplate assembly protein W
MTCTGMNAASGRAITELDHIRQSVADILLTPIGTRVMRREYGSLLPELIDQPINGATRLKAMSAVVMALLRWEPRLRPSRVDLTYGPEPGSLTLELVATLASAPVGSEPVSLTVPLTGSLV